MTGLLIPVLVGWLLLALVGLAVLSVLPRAPRVTLLPAAPVLGTALTVVVLHGTTWVVGVRWGLVALAVVVAGLAVSGARRPDRGGARPATVLALLLLPPLAGAAALGLALAPSAQEGGALVLPSSNHDGYYYVGVNEWVRDQPGVRAPDLQAAPSATSAVPFEASALRHVEQHLRLGDSLVQSAVSTVVGAEAESTWYALTATWLVLLPSAAVGVFRLLGLGTRAGLLTAVVVTTSPVLLRQAYNQNSASLLGVALAPLALVAVAEALSARPRLPRWTSALLAAGLFGTYTEYAAAAVPALVLAVLLRPPRQVPGAAIRAVGVGLLAAAMAPLVVINAVRSLLFLSSVPAVPWVSPFLDAPLLTTARVTGAVPVSGMETGLVLPVLLAVTGVTGLVAAALLAPRRGLWAGLALAAALAAVQYSAVSPRPYTQQRLVEIVLPVLVVAAGAGWAVLARRSRRPVGRVLALVVGLLWAAAGATSSARQAQQALASPRPVDGGFEEAAGWVRELGGDDGQDVSVLAGAFFDQLWLAEALRDERLVSYPALDPSYFTVEAFWGGEVDPLLLVDRATYVDAPAEAVLRENERFRLLATDRAPMTAAVTLGFSAGQWFGAEPGPATWMTDAGRVVVWRSDPAIRSVALDLQPNPDLAAVPVTVEGGAAPVSGEVTGRGTRLTVPLPPGQVGTTLLLRNLVPAVPAVSAGDPRPLSVRLTGVTGAP